MVKSKYFIGFILVFFSLFAFAMPVENSFTEGKEYQIIKSAIPSKVNLTNVSIIEFFSYGCPACYHFEPVLKKWLATKPKNVSFERIPVIFHQGWDVYSRTYFAANAMKQLDKIHEPLFNAIHKENKPLDDETSMANFIAQQGLNRDDFINHYRFMPMIGAQLEKSEKLMRSYEVYEIPTIVVAEKYRTSMAMVNGDETRFLALINFLIEKAREPK